MTSSTALVACAFLLVIAVFAIFSAAVACRCRVERSLRSMIIKQLTLAGEWGRKYDRDDYNQFVKSTDQDKLVEKIEFIAQQLMYDYDVPVSSISLEIGCYRQYAQVTLVDNRFAHEQCVESCADIVSFRVYCDCERVTYKRQGSCWTSE